MSDKEKSESSAVSDSSPLDLLVTAANAKSKESASMNEEGSYQEALERATAAHAREQQQRAYGEAEWREAMHRDSLQREALERKRIAIERESLEQEAIGRELLHRRAALMGYGRGAVGGLFGSQEEEYLRQLRLEAIVQQRRRETFAQLAIAQEMGGGYDYHAVAQAQHFRQAALLRQAQQEQMMLLSGRAGDDPPVAESVMSRSVGGDRYDQDPYEKKAEERIRKEKYKKQQQLANLGFGQLGTSSGASEMSTDGRERQRPQVSPRSMSTQHPTSKAKESKKTPRSKKAAALKPQTISRDSDLKVTIVSCPARGMPSDHDAFSAHFKIPDDIKHGTDLVCSYYGCRNAGAQFRFCTTCNMPVSRWNFTKLHRHEGGAASLVSAATDSDKGSNAIAKPEKVAPSTKGAKYTITAAVILAKLVEKGAKEVRVDHGGQKAPQLKKSGKAQLPLNSKDNKKLVEARRDQWEELLVLRPRSEESIVDWVQQVLAISDVDSSLDHDQPSEPSEVVQVAQNTLGIKRKQQDIEKTVEAKNSADTHETLSKPGPKPATDVKKEQIDQSAESVEVQLEGSASEVAEKPANNNVHKEMEKSAKSGDVLMGEASESIERPTDVSANDCPGDDKAAPSKDYMIVDEEKSASVSVVQIGSSERKEAPDVTPEAEGNGITASNAGGEEDKVVVDDKVGAKSGALVTSLGGKDEASDVTLDKEGNKSTASSRSDADKVLMEKAGAQSGAPTVSSSEGKDTPDEARAAQVNQVSTSSKDDEVVKERSVSAEPGAPAGSSEGKETPDETSGDQGDEMDYASDDGSFSSEDLRASKKSKISQ